MKRFQFHLQKLLEIRAHKEKLIKNELARIETKKNLLIEKKEGFLEEDKDARRKMRIEEKEEMLTVERFGQYQQYFKRLKASIGAQDKLIELAEEEKKLINNRLVQARKDKRVLERLKEKKIKEYMYQLSKEDQEFFDEVGNNSFLKKLREIKSGDIHDAKTVKEKIEIPIKYNEYEKNVSEQLYDEIIQKGELAK